MGVYGSLDYPWYVKKTDKERWAELEREADKRDLTIDEACELSNLRNKLGKR